MIRTSNTFDEDEALEDAKRTWQNVSWRVFTVVDVLTEAREAETGEGKLRLGAEAACFNALERNLDNMLGVDIFDQLGWKKSVTS